MPWPALFHPDFALEAAALSEETRIQLFATVRLLEEVGPTLGRPTVGKIKGSKVSNLKELRFTADGGVWRVAFAFDNDRTPVLLVAGDKAGISEAVFYKRLNAQAYKRWRSW